MRLHFFTRNWTLNFPEFFKWWHNRVIYCFVVKPSDWFKKIGISFLWKKLDLVSNPSNPETVIFSIPDLRKAQKTTIILLFTPFWSKLVWFGKNQKPKLKSDFRLFMYTTTIGAVHKIYYLKIGHFWTLPTLVNFKGM